MLTTLSKFFLFLILLLFSFFLMFHTFSYDAKSDSMLIATKAWSDFGSHIPLIRSFSMGDNFNRLLRGQAPEYPLYPGEPIRYHFLFYAIVGLLEKVGLRIDWALNISSALGFFFLVVMIWVLAKELFKDGRVAFLSLIFFLFNGSLSFLNFFKQHPLSLATPRDLITNSHFPSFGPWDGGQISAFWTLNIYTNQRHLALSYTLLLLIILIVLTPSVRGGLTKAVLTAFLLNLLLFFNYPTATMAGFFLLWSFIVKQETRLPILLGVIFTLPGLFVLSRFVNLATHVTWQPGYLTKPPLTALSFLQFWVANLGLHVLFIPLGFILTPRPVKKLLIVPLILLFLLPNLFRFSPDIINNHKFFNFFLILGTMSSAYALNKMFFKSGGATAGGLLSVLLLTFSGLIDFFPILNDTKESIPDIRANPDARFFATRTPKDAVVANSTWFYHPASLAGRTIFNGYSYFTWSYGYNQATREKDTVAIYQAQTPDDACSLLRQNGIDYVELSKKPEDFLKPNKMLWKSFQAIYENPKTGRTVYTVDTICKQ